jgi:hypothetical protein
MEKQAPFKASFFDNPLRINENNSTILSINFSKELNLPSKAIIKVNPKNPEKIIVFPKEKSLELKENNLTAFFMIKANPFNLPETGFYDFELKIFLNGKEFNKTISLAIKNS